MKGLFMMKVKKALFFCLLLCVATLLSACGSSSGQAQSAATATPTAVEVTDTAPESPLSDYEEAPFAGAQAALDELYDLGLLSTHHCLDPEQVSSIRKTGEETISLTDRLLPPCYYVNCATVDGNWITIYVDIDSGKALSCNVSICPQEGDPQLDKEPVDMGSGDISYYDSFSRIMRDDMTLEDYCKLLNDYWGFDGYTISGTQYADYGYDTEPPAGDTLIRDLMDQPFVTLYFEGDQEGIPMFLEGHFFPGLSHFSFGFGHAVG